jgi:hypothetical protein
MGVFVLVALFRNEVYLSFVPNKKKRKKKRKPKKSDDGLVGALMFLLFDTYSNWFQARLELVEVVSD